MKILFAIGLLQISRSAGALSEPNRNHSVFGFLNCWGYAGMIRFLIFIPVLEP